ncbi:hypothetical protein [Streptomyces sp. bgisy031]|uniref:hypothetical protein n=1 Tax=Streptomyces sp. bgisy031 TaxID=3413772 RepID=UPI003D70E7B9
MVNAHPQGAVATVDRLWQQLPQQEAAAEKPPVVVVVGFSAATAWPRHLLRPAAERSASASLTRLPKRTAAPPPPVGTVLPAPLNSPTGGPSSIPTRSPTPPRPRSLRNWHSATAGSTT